MSDSKPTIRTLRARPVLAPIRRPPIAASGAIPAAPLVLIDIETDAGVCGRAYVFTFTRWALGPVASCMEGIFESIRGAALEPLELNARLRASLRLMDTPGLVGIALAGIDMALWDAHARVLGVSLSRALGGAPRKLPAYNSCGLWIGPVEGLADEAAALLEEGQFEAVKLRLGRPGPADDLQAVRSVRAVLKPGQQLMSDYNQSLSPTAALERGRMLDGEGLSWIEEPIAHDDYENYARICEALETPVQTGENLLDTRSMRRAIALNSLDLVMPDVQRIGGVTGWLRAAALADAHGIAMSSHLFPEFSRHLLTVTPTAHWLEFMDWANPVLLQPVTVEGGHVDIPDTPGAGIEWDEAAVQHYLV